MSKRPNHDPWADYKKFQETRWVNNFLPVNPAKRSRFIMFDALGVTLILVAAAIFFRGSIIVILPILLVLWLCIGITAYRGRKSNNAEQENQQSGGKAAT